MQLAQAQLFAAVHRQTVDQRQLFRHLIAGVSIALPRRFQVGAVVFALDAGADAQQIDDDPQQQRHHAEEQPVRQPQNAPDDHHPGGGHRQRLRQRNPMQPLKHHFETVIQLPVFSQLKQALPCQNQQQRKQRH